MILLVLERTVRCSRTVRFLVMFGRFEVRFWAKMRCSKVFEVRSRSSANFTNIWGTILTTKMVTNVVKIEEFFPEKL